MDGRHVESGPWLHEGEPWHVTRSCSQNASVVCRDTRSNKASIRLVPEKPDPTAPLATPRKICVIFQNVEKTLVASHASSEASGVPEQPSREWPGIYDATFRGGRRFHGRDEPSSPFLRSSRRVWTSPPLRLTPLRRGSLRLARRAEAHASASARVSEGWWTKNSGSWNQVAGWIRLLERLKNAA